MSKDSTSSVLDDLASMVVVMELRRFALLILFVLHGAIVGLTFVRVDPSSWRASVENDLHLLIWVTEVKFTFISHVLEVSKITSGRCFFKSLLVQVMESGIATLLQRNVQSSIQVHEKLVIEGRICDSLGKLVLIWFLGNVNFDKLLLGILFLNNVDLVNIDSTDARGEKQKGESKR